MNLVTELGTIMQALTDPEPADNAGVHRRIGLTLTYHPQEKRVAAEARPNSIMYVGACPRTKAYQLHMPSISPWPRLLCSAVLDDNRRSGH
jgi:hypothetical protein